MTRRALLLGLVVVMAAALAPPSGAAVAPVVRIEDNVFVRGHARPVLHVRAGTTVTWLWRSQESHNVTVLRGPQRFHSATHTGGARFRHRMTRAGTYRIVCTLHEPGMHMTIVVAR